MLLRLARLTARTLFVPVLIALAPPAVAGVEPLLDTTWGQGGHYQGATPLKAGESTYPGCTTIASAQVLYYYQHQDTVNTDVSYVLDHAGLSGADIDGNVLSVAFGDRRYDWSAMASDLTDASSSEREATAEFVYHVGVTLNAQFGGGEGSSASGRQIENAMRYQWGYNNKSRRSMTIISKDAFGYDDVEWGDLIRNELSVGRPVMYLAQQTDAQAGHAFVLDGFRDSDGFVHVNWGWGGWGNGYFDPATLVDPSGRSWSREPMIYLGLEPSLGRGAELLAARGDAPTPAIPDYRWHGNGSLIAKASGTATGYGLTQDEAMLHADLDGKPVVFFQWEVDATDGTRLRIDAETAERATIRYGTWNDRSGDVAHERVSLPFVLDPGRDGFDVVSDPYLVVSVQFDETPAQTGAVSAEITTDAGTPGTPVAATPFTVDGRAFGGTGSLISLASGSRTGYGLTLDEAAVPQDQTGQTVFFQWEIDGSDGRKLRIEGASRATLTYGSWSSRADDVTKTVSLPYVLDPVADGRSAADGEYYTIRVDTEDVDGGTSIVATIVE